MNTNNTTKSITPKRSAWERVKDKFFPSKLSFSYQWNIKNAIKFFEKHDWQWPICSEHIHPPGCDKFEIYFVLQHHKGSDKADNMSITAVITNSSGVTVECKIRILILKTENGHCYFREISDKIPANLSNRKNSKSIENKSSKEILIENFIEIRKLGQLNENYFPTGELQLKFEIEIIGTYNFFKPYLSMSSKHSTLVNNVFNTNGLAKVFSRNIEWEIKNSNYLLDDGCRNGKVAPLFIETALFSLNETFDNYITLRLYPNGSIHNSNNDSVSVEIFNEIPDAKFLVYSKMYIMNADKKYKLTKPIECTNVILPGKGMIYDTFVKKNLLRNEILASENDILNIVCELRFMVNSTGISRRRTELKRFTHLDNKMMAYNNRHEWIISEIEKNISYDKEIQLQIDNNQQVRLSAQLGENPKQKDYFSLNFVCLEGRHLPNDFFVQYCVSILNKEKKICYARAKQNLQMNSDENTNAFGFSNYIQKSYLFDRNNELLGDDFDLTLCIQIWVISRTSINLINLDDTIKSEKQIQSNRTDTPASQTINNIKMTINNNNNIIKNNNIESSNIVNAKSVLKASSMKNQNKKQEIL